MQIISSLLSLQTEYVDDEEAINVLKESQNRVRSMAIIHEKLYKSKDLTNINFVDYIQSLVLNLFYSYNIKETQIKATLKLENIFLNIETAIPCGLIISELISNSLKYAFPNDMNGEIIVSLKSEKDTYKLSISDNGIGLPEDINFNNIRTLGLLLVNSLTEQIDGEVTIYRNHGTRYEISFKEQIYKKRI
jgi:two-component sensor histidine kinase